MDEYINEFLYWCGPKRGISSLALDCYHPGDAFSILRACQNSGGYQDKILVSDIASLYLGTILDTKKQEMQGRLVIQKYAIF